MDAGMGAVRGAGSNNVGSASRRALDDRAFIDISYENPIGNSGSKNNSGFNMNNGSTVNMTPMNMTPMNNGYPGNPAMSMRGQAYPPQHGRAVAPLPPGSDPAQQLYYKKASGSRMSSITSQSQNSMKFSLKQRRNSNSSISSMSVNKFMKRQWGKLGGSKVNVNDVDDDDFEDGGKTGGEKDVFIDTNNAEVSFDDLKHIRGDRMGTGGLGDSTPYIPTLKTNMTNTNVSKMTGDQYRRLQNAQRKQMASNFAKGGQQQQKPPPRAMSLQSGYGNPYQMYNQQSMQSSMQSLPMDQQYQRNNGYIREPMQQGVPPLQPYMPQGVPPQGYAPQGYLPQGYLPQGMHSHPYQYQGPPTGYSARGGQYANSSQGPPPLRSMSLQSDNAIRNRYPYTQVSSNPLIEEPPVEALSKKLNKIDFTDIADGNEDETYDSKPQEESGKSMDNLKENISESETAARMPAKSPNAKSDQHKITRSGIDSVVSFDSIQIKDSKAKQRNLYKLNNNSTGNTLFYSAAEFISTKSSPEKDQQTLSTNVEGIPSEYNTERTSTNKNSTNEHEQMNNLNHKIDNLILKKTPEIDGGVFENNYGAYGQTQETGERSQEGSENDTVDMTLTLSGAEPDLELIEKSKALQLPTTSGASDSIVDSKTAPALSVTPSAESSAPKIEIEPKTPNSLNRSASLSVFTPEQYGLLNDNNELLQELELVTTELAHSVSREIALEDNLRKNNIENVKSIDVALGEEDITDEQIDNIIDEKSKSNSEYAMVITKLAKQLNKERKKRYVAEEMLLENKERGNLNDRLILERNKIRQLQDIVNEKNEALKFNDTEKELLKVENEQLNLEIVKLKHQLENATTVVIPRLHNMIASLKEGL